MGVEIGHLTGVWEDLLFSCSVASDSLWPHRLRHARLPCPSPSPRVCSNSCTLSWWCHSTISFSVALLSFCLQSFPEPGSFPTSGLFVSGGQSVGASASASVLPMNIQGWFPLQFTGLISLLVRDLSRILSSTTFWIRIMGFIVDSILIGKTNTKLCNVVSFIANYAIKYFYI